MYNICYIYRNLCYLLPKLAGRYTKNQPVYINEPKLNTGFIHCTHSNGICHTYTLTACKQDQDGTAVSS
jgi:hypothetical protein